MGWAVGKTLIDMRADREFSRERWEAHSTECSECGTYVAHCSDGIRLHSVFLKAKYDYQHAVKELSRNRQRFGNG